MGRQHSYTQSPTTSGRVEHNDRRLMAFLVLVAGVAALPRLRLEKG